MSLYSEAVIACFDSTGVDRRNMDSFYLPVDIKKRVTAAIRDAVAAEREACAKIAENHKPRWANLSAGEDYISSDPMSSIAEAIRSQP